MKATITIILLQLILPIGFAQLPKPNIIIQQNNERKKIINKKKTNVNPIIIQQKPTHIENNSNNSKIYLEEELKSTFVSDNPIDIIAIIDKQDKIGFKKKSNHTILFEPQFDTYKLIENFETNTIIFIEVSKNNLHGLIDNNGNLILPCIYKEQTINNDKYKSAYTDFASTLDRNLNFCFRYSPFNKMKISRICKNDKIGLINAYGEIILKPVYDNIFFHSTIKELNFKYIKIKNNNKYGYINHLGVLQIPVMYDDMPSYITINSDFLIPVKLNNKWGFIDNKNNLVIDNKYDKIDLAEEGILNIKFLKIAINDKWGIINLEDVTSKNLVIPVIYDDIIINQDKKRFELWLENNISYINFN